MDLDVPFDVNDEALRDEFLRRTLPDAIEPLRESARPAWGRMSAQQMVEHLGWAFDLATGEQQTDCPVPPEQRERMKPFLHTNNHSSREFMNPALAGGLPPLRCSDLDAAKDALDRARRRFLAQPPSALSVKRTHPVFGPLLLREPWGGTARRGSCKRLRWLR
jgi:oxepin-CoA hydrolase/3-oxo-5,6-dehydrosuberyl-CoA semialdehyde dehydrogenase